MGLPKVRPMKHNPERREKWRCTIKVLPTNYNGIEFRSRLEAKWARYFDLCGFKWEYETEGYEMDGVRYLPDFVIKHPIDNFNEFYVEVKGKMTEKDTEKLLRFAYNKDGEVVNPILVLGDLPHGKNWKDIKNSLYQKHYENPMFFNLSTVNNKNVGVFPGVRQHGGKPVLIAFTRDDYVDLIDYETTIKNLAEAYNYKYEDGWLECNAKSLKENMHYRGTLTRFYDDKRLNAYIAEFKIDGIDDLVRTMYFYKTENGRDRTLKMIYKDFGVNDTKRIVKGEKWYVGQNPEDTRYNKVFCKA